MAIDQNDRDRIEDLQLDPSADRTEDLRTHGELVAAAEKILRSEDPPRSFQALMGRLADETAPNTADLGGTGVEGDHTTTQQGVEVHNSESTPTSSDRIPGYRGPDHPDYEFTASGGTTYVVDADNDGVWIARDNTTPPTEVLSLRRSEALDLIACLVRAVQESAGLALVFQKEARR
ncbi:hypothetical protein VX037_18095 [Gordonia sp. Z-3]|uniref:hypothetical protein n=1 Tax=Gordonia sp. Z-3 TaxID=3115408 RepID=UPI002E2A179E|nr:hypothetical protein [Gordonia sp. Z-3]MED5802939.1 hypothetical protein [Gordonia sp. Z-3]